MKPKLNPRLLFTLVCLGFFQIAFGQVLDNLRGYQYITIPPITYADGRVDIYNISSNLYRVFQNKGFGTYSEFSQLPKQAQLAIASNPCLVLSCQVQHDAPSPLSNSTVTLRFYNCHNQLVYQTSGKGGWANTYEVHFQQAVKKALRDFNSLAYTYDSRLTPKVRYPEVENTGESEETLKAYFSQNQLDPIEGIYKSYQDQSMTHYKLGVRKFGDIYKVIMLESDLEHWKTGEVKAVIEPSSLGSLFSIKYYMGNKQSIETFGKMENSALLEIELPTADQSSKSWASFLKVYPPAAPGAPSSSSTSNSGLKGSGSGFVLTPSGIVATNYHVVEGAERIELSFLVAGQSLSFNAEVLVKDPANDIALLKIQDESFSGFNPTPYGVSSEFKQAEKVFTIGYPLQGVMGQNVKVTDGIVSSLTGIQDDIRHLQITAPLQPGNSGGPLFNSEGNIIGITSSRLNEDAMGTSIQNVNYAIKANFLLNLYSMLNEEEKISRTSSIKGMDTPKMVEAVDDFVCRVSIY